MAERLALGLDFGTESARALLVDVATGEEAANVVFEYPHGVLDRELPSGVPLAPEWALQHPGDWREALKTLVPSALREAGVQPEQVIGVGVDFTSCTVLPLDQVNEPLCLRETYADRPHAWPKLWKHHGAAEEAEEITRIAAERGEKFLKRYGGKISSEWFIPKVWQVLREDPEIYLRAHRFIEGGDWIVMELTGQERRSACQAGYKACWSKEEGYPSKEFLQALDPDLLNLFTHKVPPDVYPMGTCAGGITEKAAALTGLKPGTPVAVAVIDAHSAVPASGISRPGQLLMIMGTSLCHLALGKEEVLAEGFTGVVEDGILPGYFGYEAGQAAVGDIFLWYVRQGVPASLEAQAQAEGISLFELLEREASRLEPGATGLLALDWWNGNRSILMDANLSGMILGLTLDTRPYEIYRALIEGTAFGTRVIIENFRRNGLAIQEIFACGGLAERNPLMMQIYADVLGEEIRLPRTSQASAMGAAIWGAVAAGSQGGGYDSVQDAVAQMTGTRNQVYRPNRRHKAIYDELYKEYLALHDYFGRGANPVMHRLKTLRRQALR